ncbi:MAG: hypothetical protein NTW25_15730 [Candidatus Kapabacteria bacterium]|nr:hypothetical protein [Candidatus Kapabacteria bacterium]
MNKAYLVLLVVFLISCNEKVKDNNDSVDKSKKQELFLKDTSVNNIYPKVPITADDTIIVTLNGGAYGKIQKYKGNIKRILDSYPEFNFINIVDPDSTYNHRGEGSNIEYHSLGVINQLDDAFWDGESGKDEYYFLYAYFLRKKINKPEYERYRKLSIENITNAIDIDDIINGAGTGSGHENNRAVAHIEYSICKNISNGDIKSLDTKEDKSVEFIIRRNQFLDSLQTSLIKEIKKYDSPTKNDNLNQQKRAKENVIYEIKNLKQLIAKKKKLIVNKEFLKMY